MLWFHDFRRNQRGQAVVEMALVLPILLMLIFGIVEFGRILNTYMIVTNLSREGAREGAVGGTDTEIVNAVESGTNADQFDTASISIAIDPPATLSGRPRGSAVKVTVSYPVDIIAPIIGPIIGDPFVVTSQTTMRVEG